MYLSGQVSHGKIYKWRYVFPLYMCLVFVFSEVGPKFVCWPVCVQRQLLNGRRSIISLPIILKF
jgi:hypothetical protein